MTTKSMPPPILCVNCRHYSPWPGASQPHDHACSSPSRFTIDLVTGKLRLQSDHPYYSTCEEQRAQRSGIVGDPPRCSYRGDWFEAKSPEAP